jgi:hypothetical protein
MYVCTLAWTSTSLVYPFFSKNSMNWRFGEKRKGHLRHPSLSYLAFPRDCFIQSDALAALSILGSLRYIFVLISTFFTWTRVTPETAQKQLRPPASYAVYRFA